ncbi:hypothetical protein B0H13DRAFT_1896496 [Mycena leptocephala]|nr:hypothetical protein B0H13DRAFT_1896496 [Mycena leptocephala]
MPRGRPPLDAETKAKHRHDSLQRYAANSYVGIATLFVQLRVNAHKHCAAAHRKRRRKGCLRQNDYGLGLPLPDTGKKIVKRFEQWIRCVVQDTEETRRAPPPPRPRAPHLVTGRPRQRFDPHEVLTENQKRCRALRADGFEEDNGEDSDADVPPGMCGCDRTECQLIHKNETAKRKEWKIFHINAKQMHCQSKKKAGTARNPGEMHCGISCEELVDDHWGRGCSTEGNVPKGGGDIFSPEAVPGKGWREVLEPRQGRGNEGLTSGDNGREALKCSCSSGVICLRRKRNLGMMCYILVFAAAGSGSEVETQIQWLDGGIACLGQDYAETPIPLVAVHVLSKMAS